MARHVEYSPRRTSPPRRRPSEPRGCRRPLVVLCRVMELLEQFRARYPLPLDDFQLESIRAIEGGQSVIVSEPTGAGKTLVAEFALHMAPATGKRIACTTPLKALSNQKFNDFTPAFGAETVGILTGDVKVNPHGRVLVMTTEILRNALYGSGLDDLGYIVLDECHYMGDEARGTVWEEIIVNAPADVLLVGLSATVANVKEIADWISIVHRPIVPIHHPERPVPLSYSVADLAGEIHAIDAVRAGKARVIGAESPRGEPSPAEGRWYTRRVVEPTVMIEALESRGWLPAIYFIFSRLGCERAMDAYLADGRTLLGSEQQYEVDHAINEAIAESPSIAESPLNQTIFTALRLGIGLHHAGILPGLKRLIEQLFERGLCKVVFATETMSLGIHMPAKSVVLQSLTKRTDRGFRGLTHNELTQMAGRAGRRGIDLEGQCVVALDARDGVESILRTIDADPEPIESQFKLGYGSVAQLLGTGWDQAALRHRVESSFGQYQNLKRIRGLEAEVERLQGQLEEARAYRAPCGDFTRIGRYRRVRQEVEARRLALGRGGRRGERNVVDAEPGRLGLVKRRGGGSLAALVGGGSTTRCDQQWKEIERLAERLTQKREALEAYRSAYWQEFLRVVEVLEQFGAVRGGALERSGRLISGLRHDNELVVAQVVERGVLSDLTLPEASAVCSALVEEARSGDPSIARAFLKKRPRLRKKLHQLEAIAGAVHEAQRARSVRIPVAVHAGFMPAVFRWASGEDDWADIVEASFGGHEGDLIRALRRLIDLLRQPREAPEVPEPIAELLARAARIIDRGVVLESALI